MNLPQEREKGGTPALYNTTNTQADTIFTSTLHFDFLMQDLGVSRI